MRPVWPVEYRSDRVWLSRLWKTLGLPLWSRASCTRGTGLLTMSALQQPLGEATWRGTETPCRLAATVVRKPPWKDILRPQSSLQMTVFPVKMWLQLQRAWSDDQQTGLFLNYWPRICEHNKSWFYAIVPLIWGNFYTRMVTRIILKCVCIQHIYRFNSHF